MFIITIYCASLKNIESYHFPHPQIKYVKKSCIFNGYHVPPVDQQRKWFHAAARKALYYILYVKSALLMLPIY